MKKPKSDASMSTSTYIGKETGAPVTTDYKTRKFNGEVKWVQFDIDKAAKDLDHLIKPEERLPSRLLFNSRGRKSSP
jgi:hypothetical protein